MDKKRRINRDQITSATIRRLLTHYNAFNVFELIQFAQNDGVRLPAETNAMTRKTVQHFIDKYNQEIVDAKRRVKVAAANEKRRITKEANKLKKSVFQIITTTTNDAYDAFKQCYENKQTINVIFITVDNQITRNFNMDFSTETQVFSAVWAHIKFILEEETDKDIFDKYPDGRLIITIGKELVETDIIQRAFFDGKINCLMKPIIDFCLEKIETSKIKKTKEKYITLRNKAFMLEQKYHDIGVNAEAISEISNILQIDIHVSLPFQKEYIVSKSNKKSLRTFQYINSRMNHVEFDEVSHTNNEVIMNQQELLNLMKQLDEEETYNTYKKSNLNICEITTNKAVYKLPNDYNDIVHEFETESGLSDCKLCDIKHKEVSEFIRQGVHLGETIINHDDIENVKEFHHIDMEKAYVNYKMSKYYVGFMGKPTDFRFCNKIVDVGYYKIESLVLNGRIKKWNKVLNCFNDNVYPSPFLTFLEDEGCTYDIIAGCWGSTIDFDIPQELIQFKDENGIRGYCKWVGRSLCKNLKQSFYIKSNNDFINHLSKEINAEFRVFEKEVKVSFPKQSNYHLAHMSGFITMYMITNVMEQLFEFEPEDVLKICTDGIYHTKKDVKLKNCFRNEDREKITKNVSSGIYLSNHTCDRQFNIGAFKEEHNMVEVHLGCGGSGKTHAQLTDSGLVGVCYLAPSWKLARAKQKEYGITCDTTAKASSTDPSVYGRLKRFNNVFIVDEVSMMNDEDKQQILSNFKGCKIIFCGDIGFQLPTFEGKPFSTKGMKVIYHENNYRVRCPKLLGILNEIREMIDLNINIVNFVKAEFKTVTEFDYNHIQDMILCRTHINKDKFTSKYKDLEKYYILKSDRTYGRGEIYYEKPNTADCEIRHAFTIHSIQGETANGNLYIDMNGMTNNQMLYTAISRAKYFHQIHLI
jgi:hypothetical protein